jgi:hypothetical protein
MPDNYTPRVKTLLIENGCALVRQEAWRSRNLAKPDNKPLNHGGQFHQIASLGQSYAQAGGAPESL